MVLLTAENISKSYGVRTLFKDVNLSVADRDKIGVVGVNGTGKSTLLRILAGMQPPDGGTISTANNMRLEFLHQQPDLDDELSALDQVLVDGPPEFEVVRAYEKASRQLSEHPEDTSLIEKVSNLAEKMDRVDGWTLENDAKAILTKVGIDDLDKRIGTMSGGQRRRVALARALIRPSDLLILDEPTNHLDVDTIEWLEGYLQNRTGGLLMVTHDRYFLDRVCSVIIELDQQTLHRYEGNYSTYLEKRAERYEMLRKREEKRKNLARQELEWLRRGPKARTSKSKVRVERAHKLLETSHLPEERGEVEIDTVESRLGKKTVVLEHIHKEWTREDGSPFTVVEDFSYNFARDDRLGIVGPNGAGKSTLLDIITGKTEPDSGQVDVGETVVFGYYDQEAMDLDEDERVHDYIVGISNKVETADGFLTATQMLEKFLFSRNRQWEPIKNLSGGERRRLYLLGVLMRSPNFLLLDEPTNDLDVETLNILEDYLDSFGGVLVVVSHDRHFLDRAVDHLLVFDDQGHIDRFPGSYSPWYDHKKEQEAAEAAQRRAEREAERAAAQPKKADEGPKKLSYKEKKELEGLEARIEEIEARLGEIEGEMVEQAADYEAVHKLADEQNELEEELLMAMELWEELAERL
ncbi:ABC-F family ATP-binding cassette domain-containing protein [Persicimonas caeni]|uniref:ABC-F family ATP-binding cassette domain-containing protein n=1 Tax=Persicimonas caeni TaxID=2292766 RepID=A0A4Y6PXM6_PERCE|nr:ABC-F family ATP-binding cassette domain-containing protein [Persicimonas caeni]QDG53013.1 ABC-F family ATP-binding cassette domain-containing protein [Persicimonas caeni]QED34235.1 ABC-F family ATP-binding cassette domain-containing protein [Persicimonas caeni]